MGTPWSSYISTYQIWGKKVEYFVGSHAINLLINGEARSSKPIPPAPESKDVISSELACLHNETLYDGPSPRPEEQPEGGPRSGVSKSHEVLPTPRHVSLMLRRLAPVLLASVLLVPSALAQTPTADSATVRKTLEALRQATAQLEAATEAPSPQAADTPRPRAIANVLFVFLVLSVVFESAMSVIFDWRVFIRHFEGRGVKTPVIVGSAFLVFWSYDLDIVYNLLDALNWGTASKSVTGQFLTALLIAGGSGGIFRIFSRIGIRNPEERRRKAREERSETSEPEAVDSSDTAP